MRDSKPLCSNVFVVEHQSFLEQSIKGLDESLMGWFVKVGCFKGVLAFKTHLKAVREALGQVFWADVVPMRETLNAGQLIFEGCEIVHNLRNGPRWGRFFKGKQNNVLVRHEVFVSFGFSSSSKHG
jgi:hypothetical protein